MPPQAPTAEALRLTFHRLEQEEASYAPEDFAELKRILLNRIADLELAESLGAHPPPADLATPAEPLTEILADPPPPAAAGPPTELPTASPPPTIPELNSTEALAPTTQAKKLD